MPFSTPSTCHTRAVRSKLVLTTNVPVGSNATSVTPPVCPTKKKNRPPVGIAPHTDRAVAAPGCEQRAVRAERESPDRASLVSEEMKEPAGLRVPDLRRPVVGSRREHSQRLSGLNAASVIGSWSSTPMSLLPAIEARARVSLLTGDDHGERAAVAREQRTQRRTGVQDEEALAVACARHADSAVGRRRHDARAVGAERGIVHRSAMRDRRPDRPGHRVERNGALARGDEHPLAGPVEARDLHRPRPGVQRLRPAGLPGPDV